MRRFSLVLIAYFIFSQVAISQTPSRVRFEWEMPLESYGWRPPKETSNRKFFKDFSMGKLEALDPNTRVSFLQNDVLAVYHTIEEGQDWRTATRHLEAFFVNAKDGRLLSRKEWPSAVRRSWSDLSDSEARLIPLSNGRFVVFADGAMKLYGSDLVLIKEKPLLRQPSTDRCSVQSVAHGQKIFLRCESMSNQQTRYYWLTSDTLQLLSQMPGPQGRDFSVYAVAGDDFVLPAGERLTKTELDGSSKVICSDRLCEEDHTEAVISLRYIVISGRRGIGVLDAERGLLWSKRIPPQANPSDFQFGDIRPALSEEEFAVWITSYHETLFDGVRVSSTPMLFVYDASTGKLSFTAPIEQKGGSFAFDMSPNARHLVIFNGRSLRLYGIPSTEQ